MVPLRNHRSQRGGPGVLRLARTTALSAALRSTLAWRRWPAGKNRGCQAATRREFPAHDAPFRMDGVGDVMQDLVHGVLIENSQVAVRHQIHLQPLQLE